MAPTLQTTQSPAIEPAVPKADKAAIIAMAIALGIAIISFSIVVYVLFKRRNRFQTYMTVLKAKLNFNKNRKSLPVTATNQPEGLRVEKGWPLPLLPRAHYNHRSRQHQTSQTLDPIFGRNHGPYPAPYEGTMLQTLSARTTPYPEAIIG